jgi:hypothetical protein
MNTMKRLAFVAAATIALSGVAPAQQVEWKQMINLPKGLNLPKGVHANILGIELGDSYAEAKAKLQKLLAEAPPPKAKVIKDPMLRMELENAAEMSGADTRPPIRETKRTIFVNARGGGPRIEISYVGMIQLTRELPGAGSQKIQDGLILEFSAPSSGHQVVAIDRRVIYSAQGDQPLVSDLVQALKKKFHDRPYIAASNSGQTQIYVFNNGQPVVAPPGDSGIGACGIRYAMNSMNQARELNRINANGQCDVSLDISINYGISKNHASALTFVLTDNERGKQNLAADYAFFSGYVKSLQEKVRGAAPKL